jgi:hypothetical protein
MRWRLDGRGRPSPSSEDEHHGPAGEGFASRGRNCFAAARSPNCSIQPKPLRE